jgi:hypothetical protein
VALVSRPPLLEVRGPQALTGARVARATADGPRAVFSAVAPTTYARCATAAKASRAAATVVAMFSSVWASETKPLSNCDGA